MSAILSLHAALETEIKKQRFGSRPRSLYDPIHYIMALGGKRLRPLFALLSYSLYKKDAREIVKYAAAIELFHNFTLMHDDIMDNAPLRRGKPSVHEKWNVNTAILAGDVMQVKVYDQFLDLKGAVLRDVLTCFNKCAAEVCEGQQWDMEFETRSKVSEAEYIEMIRLKTAVLLGFSLELGAILAGASASDRRHLREFGTLIGIGFQLKDDLLDVYADKKKFGKQVGGDIIANKKTFLLINARLKARGKEKQLLEHWLRQAKFDKNKKVKSVTALYDKLGIASLTEKKIELYFRKGFSHLDKISPSPARERLIAFTRDLITRQA